MTRWFIQNNRFTYMLVLLLAVAGAMAYFRMPRSEDPGYIVRTARVTTLFPGASPERVEDLVTDKLEEAIQEIPELDYIKSESRTGLSSVDVTILEQYSDIRPIWDNLRRKVDRVRPDLPAGVIGPYVNDEFGDVFGTVISLTGEGFSYADLKDLADDMRDDLLRLKDVAKVEIWGEQEERIFVEYSEARLAELGLSAAELGALLEETNIISPGGQVSNSYERLVVEPTGNFETLDDVRHVVIRLPDSDEVIFLKDIATVSPGYIEPKQVGYRHNGVPGLALAISMREGGNIIELGEEITQVVDQIRATYPVGIELEFTAFQPDVVQKIVTDFSSNLVQSVLFVIIVMLFTLGLRIGLLVASLIPTTILISFLLMAFWGISLDQISLAALVISLGLLVDNAIVLNEACVLDVTAGVDPEEAAIRSAKELQVPLLISSLTTAAAFLPIYLAESAAGEYTASIFQVVAMALLTSWFLSMTFSALLASQFVKPAKSSKSEFILKLIPPYERALRWATRRRLLTCGIALGLFVLAMVGLEFVPRIFFPKNARPMVTISMEFPTSTPIERTEMAAERVEQFLSQHETVLDYGVFIGTPAPRYYLSYSPENPKPEYAYFLINVLDDASANRLIEELRSFGREEILDASFSIRRLEYGPAVDYPVQVRIEGKDYEELQKITRSVKEELASMPQIVNIIDDWGQEVKKVVVNVDQAKAQRAGVSSQDVASSLQTYLSGFETTQYRRDEDLIPVLLRSEEPDRENAERLPGLSVFSQGSDRRVVPLEQVAEVETVWEPARIFRRNTIRTITVKADLAPKTTATSVLDDLIPWLEAAQKGWPPGYRFEIGGEKEESEKASRSIEEKLPVAVIAIILLVMAQFNSIRRTVIILLVIPLGLIGVTVGLLVSGYPLGFITFLGIISLSGIVINNGIVLIDRIRIEQEGGLSPYEATVEACKRRMRPILLTTVTTVFGMIPLVYGGGPMFSPMAVAILSGLLFATLLTLFIVPLLYLILFKIRN